MMARSPWLKRSAAAFLAAALGVCALGAASPARAAGWQANEDDALVLELRSGQYRLGDTLRGYQTPGGVCVDMADLIQSMDLPVRLDKKSRRATGWIFSESETFILDRDSFMVQTMNERRAVAESDLHDTPEGWCASVAAISSWFGVTFRADLSNLAVVIESERKLPFMEAIERRSRAARLRARTVTFDLADLPRADLPYKAWRTPAVDVMVSAGLRRSADGATSRDLRYEAYASGEVLGTSFDARLTSDSAAVPQSLRLRAYRVDPDGGLLGPAGATQVAAGDVESFAGTLTGQSAVGRGMFITNRPITRSSRFAVTTLRGELPAGWDAELYRNGQLLAFQESRADGRYEFADIELRFGENAFEVVLYGPQGQIRRERSDFPVGAESIPAGKTWYWAGILEQGRDLIDFGGTFADPQTGWRWGVGVERGIDKRTSLGLGAQSLLLKGRRRNYLEATLRRAIGPMLVELAGARQLGAGGGMAIEGQMLGKVGRINIKADVLWVNGGYESELVTPEESRAFGISADTEIALGGTRLPVQAGLRQTVSRDGKKVNEWLMRASLATRRLSLTAELGYRSTTGTRAAALDDGMRLNLLANTVIDGLRLRGNARFRLSGPDKGFESFTFNAERSLDRRSDLRGTVEYQARSRTYDFRLGYVRQFERFSLRADANATSKGALGLGLSLAMSFGPDPVSGGWRMSANKLAQFGEAAVTVFRDENGDGVRQPGEEPVEGVEVAAAGAMEQRKTDAGGRTLIDGLRPFTPVLVRVDQSSIEDPLLQPRGKGVVVVPRPGIAAEVELALSPSGEVEGSLVGADGEGLGGVQLELADQRGVAMVATLSEYDGYFLFDRVPYGDYRLRVSAASAKALGIKADLGVMLRLDRRQPSLRTGALRPEAAGRAAEGVAAR